MKAAASSSMSHFDRYRYRHTAAAGYEFMRFLGHCTKASHCCGRGLRPGWRPRNHAPLRFRRRFGYCKDRPYGSEAWPVFNLGGSVVSCQGHRRTESQGNWPIQVVSSIPMKPCPLAFSNHLTPAGGALDKALEIAEEIAASAPLSVLAIKQAINRAHSQSFEEALGYWRRSFGASDVFGRPQGRFGRVC